MEDLTYVRAGEHASTVGIDFTEIIASLRCSECMASNRLPDREKLDAACKALGPNLSRNHSAARYGISA
jgi:hypothetical protein